MGKVSFLDIATSIVSLYPLPYAIKRIATGQKVVNLSRAIPPAFITP